MNLANKTAIGQSPAVYAWEHSLRHGVWAGKAEIFRQRDLIEAEAIVAAAWAQEGRQDFLPRIGDGRGSAYARASRFCINLPRGCRDLPMILHETAHALLYENCGLKYSDDKSIGHGSSFVKMLCRLLTRDIYVTKFSYEDDAKRFGIL